MDPTYLSYPRTDAYSTSPWGINDAGQIVGSVKGTDGIWHGYLDDRGVYSLVDYPGAIYTNLLAVNNYGVMVGLYSDDTGSHSFIYDHGAFSTSSAYLDDNNDAGQVVGFSGQHGYLNSNGAEQLIDYPGAITTVFTGINNKGQIVGWYTDGTPTQFGRGNYQAHGFIYNIGSGTFTRFDDPGRDRTLPSAINDQGQVVGSSELYADYIRGFLYSAGTFSDLGPSNIPHDLSGAGQIIGVSGNLPQGFISPPSPAPVLQRDFGAVTAGQVAAVDRAHGLLANDSDPNGDALLVRDVLGNTAAVGQAINRGYGSLTVNADGSYTYAANGSALGAAPQGQHSHDQIGYTVANGHGGTASGLLDITLNRVPTLGNDQGSTDFGHSIAGAVLSNDRDPDGDALSVTGVFKDGNSAAPGSSFTGTYGTLTLGADGQFTYVAGGSAARALGMGQSAVDQFVYRAGDGLGGTAEATLAVTVTGTDHAPTNPNPQFDDLLGLRLSAFGYKQGWTSDFFYHRELADVNGDGLPDIVGFGQAGVYVSRGNGDGAFGGTSFAGRMFAPDAGGWTSQIRYPRHVADVNGDGRADIVGFADDGVYVALGTGTGSFGPVGFRAAAFGVQQGWLSDGSFPRMLADVNGDGRADIVGFGQDDVYVALGRADGGFTTAVASHVGFTRNTGWTNQDAYTRQLADVNGDGKADIVGFADDGVYVSLATGDGRFGDMAFAFSGFGRNSGWISDDRYHRELADVNGDGKVGIVGFGEDRILVALGNGNGTFQPLLGEAQILAPGAGGWTSQIQYPRHLADLNHDGAADLVGFGDAGVYTALSLHRAAQPTEPLYGVFRYFDTSTGNHFYTTSASEKAQIDATFPAFRYEGLKWATPQYGAGTVDVFRFYDVHTGDHFYTASAQERDLLNQSSSAQYRYEGLAFEAYSSAAGDGHVTLERFFNKLTGVHHLSATAEETASINSGTQGAGWVDEGAAFTVHVPSDGLLFT